MLFRSDALFKSTPALFENTELVLRFKDSVATLYVEVVQALQEVNKTEADLPNYEALIANCSSVEDAMQVLVGLSSQVRALADKLKKTQVALSDTRQCLAVVSSTLQQTEARAHSLETEADTDPMTGALNRRGLSRILPELPVGTCSVIVFDIDDFKRINDTLGHAVGDQAIQALAEIIKRQARENDYVARLGGEELALVLPHTNPMQAEAVGSRISQQLKLWKHEGLLKLGLSMTFSAGVASWYNVKANVATQFQHAMEIADKNLYRAKREGKNRIIS